MKYMDGTLTRAVFEGGIVRRLVPRVVSRVHPDPVIVSGCYSPPTLVLLKVTGYTQRLVRTISTVLSHVAELSFGNTLGYPALELMRRTQWLS